MSRTSPLLRLLAKENRPNRRDTTVPRGPLDRKSVRALPYVIPGTVISLTQKRKRDVFVSCWYSTFQPRQSRTDLRGERETTTPCTSGLEVREYYYKLLFVSRDQFKDLPFRHSPTFSGKRRTNPLLRKLIKIDTIEMTQNTVLYTWTTIGQRLHLKSEKRERRRKTKGGRWTQVLSNNNPSRNRKTLNNENLI